MTLHSVSDRISRYEYGRSKSDSDDETNVAPREAIDPYPRETTTKTLTTLIPSKKGEMKIAKSQFSLDRDMTSDRTCDHKHFPDSSISTRALFPPPAKKIQIAKSKSDFSKSGRRDDHFRPDHVQSGHHGVMTPFSTTCWENIRSIAPFWKKSSVIRDGNHNPDSELTEGAIFDRSSHKMSNSANSRLFDSNDKEDDGCCNFPSDYHLYVKTNEYESDDSTDSMVEK